MKILLVEDQDDLRELLSKRLSKEYTVDSCGDGETALDYLAVYQYDVIVLDIMLPKKNGLEVLSWMRSNKMETPVLLLSAKSSIEDRVRGLDCGADDYLVKPFSYDELLARLRVILRRKTSHTTSILEVHDLKMDTTLKTVSRGGKSISLTGKEYTLLQYMMHHPHIILTRNQLEQGAWNSEFEGSSNVLDVYIRYLRKKIDDGYEDKLIQTIRGRGYRLGGEKL